VGCGTVVLGVLVAGGLITWAGVDVGWVLGGVDDVVVWHDGGQRKHHKGVPKSLLSKNASSAMCILGFQSSTTQCPKQSCA
jgi:hypothetical protein